MGSATLVTEPGFWNADLSALHKICFFNGLLYYIATAMVGCLVAAGVSVVVAVIVIFVQSPLLSRWPCF